MLASSAALGITSTTRPCSMTQCRSATVAAKRKFCSTRRMVKPSERRRRMVAPICCTMTGARPSVGSSRRSRRAPVRRMRPMASICCSPPESLVPWLRSRSLRFGKRSKTPSRGSPPGRTSGGSRRFSSTLRLAKMPRSSGQKARPRRAMRFEGMATSSFPSNRMEPCRRGTMPMMDLRVVVLPAPLRPSSVTTSPARTSSREFSGMAGALPRSHIGLDDVGVLRDGGVVTLGEDLAASEHGDGVGEIGDHAEIVLDHEHGAIDGDLPDEGGDPLHVLMGHPRRRLVEEHHLGIEGEGGGDLEGPLAAIGQLDRRGGREGTEAHGLDQLEGPAVEPFQHALRSPEIEGASPASLEGDPNVLEHAQMREDGRDLEGADQSPPRDVGGRGAGDLAAIEGDAAARGSEEMGEEVEAGGLACPVGPDQGVDGPPADPEAHVLHGQETPELLGQTLGLEDQIGRHGGPMIAMAQGPRKRISCRHELTNPHHRRRRGGQLSRRLPLPGGSRRHPGGPMAGAGRGDQKPRHRPQRAARSLRGSAPSPPCPRGAKSGRGLRHRLRGHESLRHGLGDSPRRAPSQAGGYVVSAQNCWNDPTVAAVAGVSRAVGLVMSRISVALWKSGEVERGTEKGSASGHEVFRAGEHDGRITPRVESLAGILSVIDGARPTENLWGERWSKLCLNAMGNPVQAMTGLGSLEIAREPRGREITIRLGAESARVGLALGYTIPKFGVAEAKIWAAAADDRTVYAELDRMLTPKADASRNWRASMAQDVIKGRRSEIEYMNGHIVAKGREKGVATPVSAAVVGIMREIDAGSRTSSPAHLEEALKTAGL